MPGSDDVDLAIATKFLNDLVDQTRIDQRLVALNVDDVGKLFRPFCHPGDPIGAALVFW